MCLFLKCDRDSAKQALCLKNSLMCLATTHKSSEGGGKLSSLVCICVFVYLFILFFVYILINQQALWFYITWWSFHLGDSCENYIEDNRSCKKAADLKDKSLLFLGIWIFLAPTPVTPSVWWSVLQISTVAAPLDRHRASLDNRNWNASAVGFTLVPSTPAYNVIVGKKQQIL